MIFWWVVLGTHCLSLSEGCKLTKREIQYRQKTEHKQWKEELKKNLLKTRSFSLTLCKWEWQLQININTDLAIYCKYEQSLKQLMKATRMKRMFSFSINEMLLSFSPVCATKHPKKEICIILRILFIEQTFTVVCTFLKLCSCLCSNRHL